jgi:hypothetical protein
MLSRVELSEIHLAFNIIFFTSIWSGARTEFQTLINNSNWLVGDGETIN